MEAPLFPHSFIVKHRSLLISATLNGYIKVLSLLCNLGAVCGGVHSIRILSGGKMDVVWRSP